MEPLLHERKAGGRTALALFGAEDIFLDRICKEATSSVGRCFGVGCEKFFVKGDEEDG